MLVAVAFMPTASFAQASSSATKSHTPHVFLHKGLTRSNAKAAGSTTAANGNVPYQGGPVMGGTTNVYAIFWEPTGSVSANYNSLIQRYFGDVGSNALYGIAKQYTGTGGAGDFPAGSHLAGFWVDSGSYPETPLLDSDIQTEVTHAQTVNSWTSGIDNIFFVFLQSGENLCFDSTQTQCASNTFCAYHSFFGTHTIYAAMPYAASFNCDPEAFNAPGPNSDDADQTINVASHEQMEAATDPLLNAWIDPNDPSGGEIGDKCNFTFGPLVNAQGADVVWNNNSYLVQQEWNNAINACSLSLNPTPTYYNIVNRDSNEVMDVFGGGVTLGVNVIQWVPNGGSNQRWTFTPVGDTFNIVSLKSTLVMDVFRAGTTPGTNVIQWTSNGGLNQQWELVPDGGFDLIVNVKSFLVLDSGSTTQGANVTQQLATNSLSQQWSFTPITTPRYEIKNVNSGLVMDVFGGGTDLGTRVIQWTDHSGTNQMWTVVPDGNTFQIVNFKSGLVLDVFGGGKTLGVNVIQWSNHNGLNQQWTFLPSASACLSGSVCQIVNVNSGLVMDVFGGGKTPGVNVIQWSNHNGLNQQWTFVPVS